MAEFDKNVDVIYTGNRDYFNVCNTLSNRSLIWVGGNGNRRNISHTDKINLTSRSKIAVLSAFRVFPSGEPLIIFSGSNEIFSLLRINS